MRQHSSAVLVGMVVVVRRMLIHWKSSAFPEHHPQGSVNCTLHTANFYSKTKCNFLSFRSHGYEQGSICKEMTYVTKCTVWQLLSTYSSSFSFGPMAAQHVRVTVWQYSVYNKIRAKLACEPFQGTSWLPSGLVCAWQPVLTTAYPVAVFEFKCGGGVGVEASLHMGASSHCVPDPLTSASRTWVPVLLSLSSCVVSN